MKPPFHWAEGPTRQWEGELADLHIPSVSCLCRISYGDGLMGLHSCTDPGIAGQRVKAGTVLRWTRRTVSSLCHFPLSKLQLRPLVRAKGVPLCTFPTPLSFNNTTLQDSGLDTQSRTFSSLCPLCSLCQIDTPVKELFNSKGAGMRQQTMTKASEAKSWRRESCRPAEPTLLLWRQVSQYTGKAIGTSY